MFCNYVYGEESIESGITDDSPPQPKLTAAACNWFRASSKKSRNESKASSKD